MPLGPLNFPGPRLSAGTMVLHLLQVVNMLSVPGAMLSSGEDKDDGDIMALVPGFLFFFSFIFISWRLITLQYCSGFCHTLT